MNNKAPLALMSQLLMVLFFALAAAICLQAFAKSDGISKDSANRDAAVLCAQNAAETLKSTHGDLAAAKEILGGNVSGTAWTVAYDADWNVSDAAAFRMDVLLTDSDVPGLGMAVIKVLNAQGTELFSLTCAWQEAAV